jgi:hypothetical protein
MRFINLINSEISSETVINFKSFFPIIKDINLDVSMVVNSN